MIKRCSKRGCKKKLSLTDLSIPCKCEHYFCKKHRSPEEHDCSFNFNFKDTEKKKMIEIMKCDFPKVIQI